MSASETTTDHETIRKWVEARDGRPSRVKSAGGNGGLLRIDFGEPEQNFEEIGWDEFFRIFDANKLAFLHQEETEDGRESRFNKFINRS
ncbi:hypothetical protein FBZ98_104340 [Rhizobium sp. ERR 922]|uniref:hypothetical protein n=1 Tax=unclassified Rhizobium TaxID=2613769 RepID=UPI0011A02D68|nr:MULTISPECIES: hypothetical protein [unclassified Rhizobium]TWB53413.1 hypothetical protein FBZ98_104340 [Rhizobium sp. ERR 922]TWB95623.1 hypothetical protein FBZ97_104311 [Rhizobium sp. ERR 942]